MQSESEMWPLGRPPTSCMSSETKRNLCIGHKCPHLVQPTPTLHRKATIYHPQRFLVGRLIMSAPRLWTAKFPQILISRGVSKTIRCMGVCSHDNGRNFHQIFTNLPFGTQHVKFVSQKNSKIFRSFLLCGGRVFLNVKAQLIWRE